MISGAKNPFLDLDDDDNSNYGNRTNSGYSNPVQSQLMQSRQNVQQSQQRILQSIYQSEEIGVKTAEELLDQGEKLKNVERKLDEIAEMQKDSQRHINNLNSIFGGMKNWFAKKGVDKSTIEASKPAEPPSALRQVVNSTPAPNYDFNTRLQNNLANADRSCQEQQQSEQFRDSEYDKQYNANMHEISSGVGRLKGLARGLNQEITQQNELLDRTQPKVENVTATMNKQNQNLNVLLYGSKTSKK